MNELLVQQTPVSDWQECQVDVHVNTAGHVRIGKLTFRASGDEARNTIIQHYHEAHPLLNLNVQAMTIRPVESNAPSFFTPIEQLEPHRSDCGHFLTKTLLIDDSD